MSKEVSLQKVFLFICQSLLLLRRTTAGTIFHMVGIYIPIPLQADGCNVTCARTVIQLSKAFTGNASSSALPCKTGKDLHAVSCTYALLLFNSPFMIIRFWCVLYLILVINVLCTVSLLKLACKMCVICLKLIAQNYENCPETTLSFLQETEETFTLLMGAAPVYRNKAVLWDYVTMW